MTLTLREEVLKNSGILTEEILEEGFLKKAALIATVIAGLAGAAIGGPKIAKEVKQYKNVKDVPVATRYEKADIETNKDIKNKEYFDRLENIKNGIKYSKLRFVKSIKSDYNDRNNQAVIHINVDNTGFGNYRDIITSEIEDALNEYVKYLNKEYSSIENTIKAASGEERFDTVPLKVVVHFTQKVDGDKFNPEYGKKKMVNTIQGITGTSSVEFAFDEK